ncbi:MAG: sensor histidine kinase [Cyclobacteriaceae bacterium]
MKQDFFHSFSTIETILNSTDDGIILFDVIREEENEVIGLRYNFLNKSAERIIGSSQEVIGKKLTEVHSDYRYNGLFEAYLGVVRTGKNFRTEWYYEADGIRNWFRIVAQPLDNKLLVSFNDITDYKLLIEEKSRNAVLYRSLIRSLPHAYLLLLDKDLNCLIVEGNPLQAFGFEGRIQEGDALTEKMNPIFFNGFSPMLQKALKGEGSKTEIRDGESLYRIHIQPVKDDEGSLFSILILSEDIAIFQKTSNELRNQIYALDSANQSLEQFAYVASHDLQEPLRKIRAFGDRIKAKYEDSLDDTGKDYLSRMQNAAGRMQKLIDDLLKFSRAGRVQNPFEPVRLVDVVKEAISSLEISIEETKAEVIIEELPEVEGDAAMLEQLFQNLISNGIKFRKENEKPRIRIYAEEEPEVTSDSEHSQAYYSIIVEDNGIGFDEKYLDRIFEIFQRLHGRNVYTGTGIGLAICKKIVDSHQGEITARSKPGEGASFIIRLPQKINLF